MLTMVMHAAAVFSRFGMCVYLGPEKETGLHVCGFAPARKANCVTGRSICVN